MLDKIKKQVERNIHKNTGQSIKYLLENKLSEEEVKARIRRYSDWDYIETIIYFDDEFFEWWFDLARSTRRQYKNKLTNEIDDKVKEVLKFYF